MKYIEESRVIVLPFVTRTSQWGDKYNEIVPITDDMIRFMHSSIVELVDTHQKLLQNSDFRDILAPTDLMSMTVDMFSDLIRQNHRGVDLEWFAVDGALTYKMICTINMVKFSNHLKFNIKTEKLNVTKSSDTKSEGA